MRPRMVQAIRVALAAVVVLLAGPRAAQAQVLVMTERDLAFGMLTAGAPTTVPPSDVVRSAQMRIEGRGTFQISFLLPTSLTALRGDQIPLVFGATDGLLTVRSRTTVIDPNAVNTFRLNPADLEARINLGGRAQPAAGQTAGVYSATIVVIVVPTGT